MKTVYKYYKGNLLCEFQTINTQKVGKSTVFTSQSQIALEPRYRYEDVEEITEAEYFQKTVPGKIPFIKQTRNADEKWTILRHVPFLTQSGKMDVECTFHRPIDPAFPSAVKRMDEIVMVLNKGNAQFDDKEPYFDTRPVQDYIKPEEDNPKDIYYNADKVASANQTFHFDNQPPKRLIGLETVQRGYYSPFDAVYGKASHGKIKGLAYCREVQMFSDQMTPITITEQNELIAEQRSGCLGSSRNGCLGAFMPTGGLMGGAGGGAQGCGCFFPLILLLVGALLGWLLGIKGCQDNKSTAPIIIHDTIKVEVQKVDTLTIVKTDTLSYVDSTTKLNYETVNLPNVQFITNSDVLLPSSASDLQKLAEYLTKNDSLNATIFGHTDNVGKPDENMKLSQRRAESVKRFLGSLGVDPKRLNAVGKGDTEPKADNDLKEGRLMNRRVEVQLTNTEFVTTKRTKLELVPEDTGNKEKKKNHP